jgi:hypothetical protein
MLAEVDNYVVVKVETRRRKEGKEGKFTACPVERTGEANWMC